MYIDLKKKNKSSLKYFLRPESVKSGWQPWLMWTCSTQPLKHHKCVSQEGMFFKAEPTQVPRSILSLDTHTHAYTCTFFSISRLRLGSKKVRYGSWYSWSIIYELSLSFLYLKSWHSRTLWKSTFCSFQPWLCMKTSPQEGWWI